MNAKVLQNFNNKQHKTIFFPNASPDISLSARIIKRDGNVPGIVVRRHHV